MANAGGAAAAVREADDALQEQVLVAAFPDESPEVHVASLDTQLGTLSLKEASVRGRGEVSMGPNRTIDLADVGSMDSEDGTVALLGHDHRILVQLHMESFEDQQTWANAIRALLTSRPTRNGAGGQEGGEEDLCMLQAKSQQLQNKIGVLEGVGKRREMHLQKMQKRVDGAMRMLAAVKDMCAQQRRVLEAQKVAIVELRQESGEPGGEPAEAARGSEQPNAAERPAEAEPEAEAEEASVEDQQHARDIVAMGEEEIAAKTKQMLELLQQADEMQRVATASPAAAAPAEGDDEEGGDPTVVLRRLQELQAEKERYEGMVRESTQEHEDLLKRLSDMRSLMSALGMQDEGGSD